MNLIIERTTRLLPALQSLRFAIRDIQDIIRRFAESRLHYFQRIEPEMARELNEAATKAWRAANASMNAALGPGHDVQIVQEEEVWKKVYQLLLRIRDSLAHAGAVAPQNEEWIPRNQVIVYSHYLFVMNHSLEESNKLVHRVLVDIEEQIFD